jgi:phosphocarrier protein FPr
MTVGLVLVSHSAAVARGAADLARQMAGDVAIEPAGGLDEPDDPLGTDATLVSAAIDRADSGDGVLVLMDLGSAVLSAQTALDLLERADPSTVRLSEAALVEGAAAAGVAAEAGASLDDVAAEARNGLAGKAADIEPEPESSAEPATPLQSQTSAQVDVVNRLGVHARPAAKVVRSVGELDADVRIANRTTGRGPVSARSLTGLATLGAVGGHRLEITASGTDADTAVSTLRQLAADGFGDRDNAAPSDSAAAPDTATAAPGTTFAAAPDSTHAAAPDTTPTVARSTAEAPGATINGLPGAPGSGYGPVRHLHLPEPSEVSGTPGSPDGEAERLRGAIAQARRELAQDRDEAGRAAGENTAGILDAQVLLLSDAAVTDAAETAARDGAAAADAWRQAADSVAATYREMENEYQRARADDVDDVSRRVLAHLAGVSATPRLAAPGVLVAETLGPADTAGLDPETVQAILTARGAPTGHAAIMARARNIPAVVGAGDSVLALSEGQDILVDGDTGTVRIDPEDALVREYAARRAERAEHVRAAQANAHEPAITSNGARIHVVANVGSIDEAGDASSAGAEGVGLLRTEFLFADRAESPTEDEQFQTYTAIGERLGGSRVRVRTFDLGADKPARYLDQQAEGNPFLGVRGVRLALEHEDVLQTQLRSICRAAESQPLDIMVPMVSTVDELERVRTLLDQAGGSGLRLGMMVEVPAAALLADVFAARVDFFSIGTNDLVQYTLAAERGNAAVAELADPCHPAVLRLIKRVADAASSAGIEAAVCGEMASDPQLAPLLIGLGIGELSVTPSAVASVKQAVRETSHADAQRLADAALAAESASDVRALLPGRSRGNAERPA